MPASPRQGWTDDCTDVWPASRLTLGRSVWRAGSNLGVQCAWSMHSFSSNLHRAGGCRGLLLHALCEGQGSVCCPRSL